ncbi:MAG: hypothetical protein O7H41_15880 [Planctomycetota bacterium]|nr:hypothetical protein [Planctomycetota bacterium]
MGIHVADWKKVAALLLVIAGATAGAVALYGRRKEIPRVRPLDAVRADDFSAHGSATIGSKIYPLGAKSGVTRDGGVMQSYDPATDSWIDLEPIPTQRSFAALAALEDGIYVIGGTSGTNDFHGAFERYGPVENLWTRLPDLPTPRNRLAAAAVAGKIYVIGGMVAYSGRGNTDVVEEYDPESDRWTTKSRMPTVRHGHAAVVVSNRIYTIGGYTTTGDALIDETGTLEVYDPSANQWSRGAPMPTKRGWFGAASIGGRIYVFGGRTGGIAPTEVYDTTSDTWETRAPLPEYRQRFVVGVAHGRIHVFPGERTTREIQIKIWIYDPLADTWGP